MPGRQGGATPSVAVEAIALTSENQNPASTRLTFLQDGQEVGFPEDLASPGAAGRTFAAPAQLDLARAWQLRTTVMRGVTGSVTLALREPVRTTKTVALGATTPVTFRAFGDTTELTFTPHADRHIVVECTGNATAGSTLQLRAADGTPVGDPVFEEAGWTEYPLTTSTRPLTLVVGLDPQDPRTGTLNVVVREVTDPVLRAGRPAKVTFAAAQNPRIVFEGRSGERLTLDLSAMTWTPTDQWVIVSLVTPTGRMRFGPVSAGETRFMDLGLLQGTGR